MATISEVLIKLIPNGGWVARGGTYEGIEFISCDPISKQQFLDGFAIVDAEKLAAKQKITDLKTSIATKMSSPTYTPLTAQEVAFLMKAIS